MATNFKYASLADEIEHGIESGIYRAGEKLPSLRKLHLQMGLSIATVHQAYIELERRGTVQAKEKSGFFVKALKQTSLKTPVSPVVNAVPRKVSVNDLAKAILSDLQSDNLLKLGAAVPSKALMPLKQLARLYKSIPSDQIQHQIASYEHYDGLERLRKAISQRMLSMGCRVPASQIITTSGCLEAVAFCLRAVAEPGDTVLVESPVFHCFLQLIEDLNLYVLEIPGSSDKGIDPDAFRKALNENPVKACLLNSNFHNPLGSVVPEENKRRILDIAADCGTVIIEDDIYGDLFFGKNRPETYKSLDTRNQVLYCSSFSKTVAPGLRTGWIAPGSYKDTLSRLKLNTRLSDTAMNQAVVAQFIESGAFDRHLRQLRNHLKNNASAMIMAVSRYFPENTRVSFPKGGMCLWVELDPKIDSLEIYHTACQKNISILPGIICSSSDGFRHCLRLNYGILWSDQVENGIKTLGKLIKEML